MINTANILLLLLASGTGKFGLNVGASGAWVESLNWIGPCARLSGHKSDFLLKVTYVYNHADIGSIYPYPYYEVLGWGHGLGLGLELIPRIHTTTTPTGACCIPGCLLGVDPYIGLSGNLIRRVAPDSSRCWDLWLLGYTGINIPIGYRDTLTGEPKVLPFELSLFLSAGCRKRFNESQEITPVVMLGLGLNVWLFGWGRKTPHQEVKP